MIEQPTSNNTQNSQSEPRVVVRLVEGVQAPRSLTSPGEGIRQEMGIWQSLVTTFPKLRLSPVFDAADSEEMKAMATRREQEDPNERPIDFGVFHYVDVAPQTDLHALVQALRSLPGVQEAYIDRGASDPLVNADNDPRATNQGHLAVAPGGIDARFAWTIPGGDGAGQRLIDVEQGWTLNHEDLVTRNSELLHGEIVDASRNHGSSVLGIVAAVDNTIGCVGIAPNIGTLNVVSYRGTDNSLPKAIREASKHLSLGDVLLIEAQKRINDQRLRGPVEVHDAEYEAIREATRRGIIVIEPGGNGTENLAPPPDSIPPPLDMDTYRSESGKAILNRDPANKEFRDSGAIIVSAATSAAPHTRLDWAPHGRRIDCYAWGENINTLASTEAGGTTNYTTAFGGTSGASAIIASAAVAVQGIVEAHCGSRISPRKMREILSDAAAGTPPSTTETTAIGVMPNLRAFVEKILGGVGQFWNTDGRGGITLVQGHPFWRKTWSQIVPGNFGGNGFTDLLFYEPTTGTGQFYTCDGRGGIRSLALHDYWRRTWTHIIPGNFGGNGYTDLLFYDAAAGTGEFYTTDGRGGLTQLALHDYWRRTWTHIIPGNFGGNGYTDLLFYDAAAGTSEFYTTDGRGGLTQLALHDYWRRTWTHIIPGNFGGNGYTDLLFYDAAAGTGEFYTTDGRGGLTQLALHDYWRRTWTHIIPGNFGGNGYTDLLFYDAAAGTGEFYTTDGLGGIIQLAIHDYWRKTWARIIPGNFGGDGNTDLLFYDARS